MNKKKYVRPEMEIVAFESEDMIVASLETPDDVWEQQLQEKVLGIGFE